MVAGKIYYNTSIINDQKYLDYVNRISPSNSTTRYSSETFIIGQNKVTETLADDLRNIKFYIEIPFYFNYLYGMKL